MTDKGKLDAAVNTIFDSLNSEWSDNGNTMADDVRDSAITTLSTILDRSFEDVVDKIDVLIEDAQ